MAKKEKQKVVVWMSRDTATYYEFWKVRPKWDKFYGGYQKTRNSRSLHVNCEYDAIRRLFGPVKLNNKRLLKLTITAERAE